MSDSLANQGDELAARFETDDLVAALSGAVAKGWHREYEQGHPQHRGPDDTTLAPGERYTDSLQGSGQIWVSGPASSDDLAGQLSAALGLAPSMRLRRV